MAGPTPHEASAADVGSDVARIPAQIQSADVDASIQSRYAPRERRFQGIPGIELLRDGSLAMTFYSGGAGEGPENHVVLVRYDGREVTDPIAVIDPPGQVRAFDPGLWRGPDGHLYWYWNQSDGWFDGRAGVFVAQSRDDSSFEPALRVGDGIMMNKPTVRASGDWLLPIATWNVARRSATSPPGTDASQTTTPTGAHLYRGRGIGSLSRLDGPNLPERAFDEHMVLEREDGSLVMAVRTQYGIGRVVSADGGETWHAPRRSGGVHAPSHVYRVGPSTRFHLRRLASGRVLLVYHESTRTRSHLTAYLSEDEGETFPWSLLLDEREGVSYPDVAADSTGRMWVIYDRERTRAKEILLALVTEEEILDGRVVDSASFRKRVITSGGA